MKSIELARLIAVYSYNNKIKSVSDEGGIARSLGLPPLPIINALNAGEKQGVFTLKRVKGGIDKVMVSDEQFDEIVKQSHNFGPQLDELVESFEEAVYNANSRETDINRDQLYLWAGGENLSPALFDTAIYILTANGEFATYTIGDPKDKKTVYTFLTLAGNEDKRWGLKQLGK